MANTFQIILMIGIAIISTIFIASFCFSVYLFFKARQVSTPPNTNLAENMNSQFTGGYYFGRELECKKILFEGNERYHIKFIPIGRFYDGKKEEYAEPLKTYEFIIPFTKRIVKAAGEPHKSLPMVLYLPKNPHNVPNHYQNSELGNWIKQKINVSTLKEAFITDVNSMKDQISNYLLESSKLPDKIILAHISDIIKNVLTKIHKEEKQYLNRGVMP